MVTSVRAVVVGGGCVGAGILYGLAKRGWTDVALLERTQLTAARHGTPRAHSLLRAQPQCRPDDRQVDRNL